MILVLSDHFFGFPETSFRYSSPEDSHRRYSGFRGKGHLKSEASCGFGTKLDWPTGRRQCPEYWLWHGGGLPDPLHHKESGMLAKAVTESLQPMSTMYAVRKLAGSLGIWRLVVHFREKMHLASPPSVTVSYDADNARRIIPGMIDRYLTMANFAKRHGAKLIIAVQPDIYTTEKPLTQEEVSVRDRYTNKFVNIKEAYPNYRADFLHELRIQIADDEAEVIDLRGIFDSVSDPMFLDHCYFNDRGYKQIASLLHNRIGDHYQNQ